MSAAELTDACRKGKGETARERMIRQERHKVHVMALLAMGLIRNRWLNDPELQVSSAIPPFAYTPALRCPKGANR